MPTFIGVGIRASIFLLVFCIGLAARVDDWKYLLRRPGQLARSLLSMMVVMPLVASALAVAFGLGPAVTIALIALSVSPVPPLLPKKEVKAGGSADYAFGLLVAAVMFSIVFVPVAMALIGDAFGRSVRIPPGPVAKVVFCSALIPLGAGLAVRRVARRFAERAEGPLSKLAALLLLASLLPVLVVAWPAIVALAGGGALVAIVLYCVSGLVVGHLLGGPEDENRTVLALSTASRHPGVAITVANIGFPGQKAAVVATLLILFVSAVASSVYLAWHRRRGSAGSRPPRGTAEATSSVTR